MEPLDLIKEYINSHADHPPENLTLDSKLDAVGLDSLALLELMFKIEDKYNIKLPDDTKKPESIGQLVELVEKFKPSAGL
jgi:acyl carrier protein